MKHLYFLLTFVLLFSVVLSACGKAATPQPESKATQEPAAEMPVKEVVETVEEEKEVEVMMIEATETPRPPSMEDYGEVTIYSAQPLSIVEQEAMRGIVLADFSGTPEYTPFEESALIDRLKATANSTQGPADMIVALHATYPDLVANNLLLDLSDMVVETTALGIPKALMTLGKLGTDKQFYIPLMQDTFILGVNKKAMDYLPSGVDVNALTWEQVRDWGKAIEKATGKKMLGIPASELSLLHCFLQGSLYPSFSGGMVTEFWSEDAVEMWTFMKDLWRYVDPQAINYSIMQEQLLSGEVWIAFDHADRLIEAFNQEPDNFLALPSPSGPEGLGFMTEIVGIGIPKNAPNLEGARQMIRYLLQDDIQVQILREIGFFPVVDVVLPDSINVGIRMEGDAVALQASSPKAIPAVIPLELGLRVNEFNNIYRDTFTRIVIEKDNIKTVLAQEGTNLQILLDNAGTPCWPPDPPSKGVCQLK